MSKHPALKFNFHTSGHLLQWLEKEHAEVVDLLAQMVESGQVELLAGGFYEPILAAIPRSDRRGQIRMYKSYLKKRFGVDPRGIWLTERVWESEIVDDLIASGVRYVVVDDRHFRVSGFDPEALHSYYLTEAEGKPLAVFPIDERLRYSIPFRPVEELARYLEQLHQGSHEAAIYMDDGEKFGGWPGTHEWVYEKKWLEQFLDNLDALQGSFLQTATFSDLLKRVPPKGICYLPNASYTEMEEWALPAARALELASLKKRLSDAGGDTTYLRGGHWKNFLVKYPEANWMHKKMLLLSKMVRQRRRDLADFLYRAQCNDAYWHGVFGGLYLPHLRHAVWRNLAAVEKGLRKGEGLQTEICDLDLDGHDELWAHSGHLSAVFKPSCGGQLKEYILLSTGVNYLATLSRRFEAYHQRQQNEGQEKAETGIASIHDLSRTAEEPPVFDYDRFERGSYLDHFFTYPLSLEDFKKSAFAELGDFCCHPFSFKLNGAKIAMRREGVIRHPDHTERRVDVFKEFNLSRRGSIEARYRLRNPGPGELRAGFGVEFNLAFPAMNAQGGELKTKGIEAPLGGEGSALQVKRVDLCDWLSRTRIELQWSVPAGLHFFPVKTISQSEKGFDAIPQQLCLMPYWPVVLGPGGSWAVTIAWNPASTG